MSFNFIQENTFFQFFYSEGEPSMALSMVERRPGIALAGPIRNVKIVMNFYTDLPYLNFVDSEGKMRTLP